MRVADDAIAAVVKGTRVESPRQKTGIGEKRVGNAVRRYARELSQEDREDERRKQRLHDDPRNPDHRLLVAHLEVAPCQKVEQFAVGPQVAQIHGSPTAIRFNDDQRLFR